MANIKTLNPLNYRHPTIAFALLAPQIVPLQKKKKCRCIKKKKRGIIKRVMSVGILIKIGSVLK